MIWLGVIAALAVLGWMAWLVLTAPEGWEDESGFHLGERGDE